LSNLLKEVEIHLGVICRHVNAAVTKDKAYLIEGNAMPKHLGCRGMAQQVGTTSGGLDARSSESSLNDIGDAAAGSEGFARGDDTQKNTISRLPSWPTL
jgi:hypothetical protein